VNNCVFGEFLNSVRDDEERKLFQTEVAAAVEKAVARLVGEMQCTTNSAVAVVTVDIVETRFAQRTRSLSRYVICAYVNITGTTLNVARMRRPSAYAQLPNLTTIGKRCGWVGRAAPNFNIQSWYIVTFCTSGQRKKI